MAIRERSEVVLMCDACGAELVEESNWAPSTEIRAPSRIPLTNRVTERADAAGWYWPQPDEDDRQFCPTCRQKERC